VKSIWTRICAEIWEGTFIWKPHFPWVLRCSRRFNKTEISTKLLTVCLQLYLKFIDIENVIPITNLTHNSLYTYIYIHLFSYLFILFISIFYMFRATLCSSSGESIVSIQHLVYVTLYRWPSGMQVGKEPPDLHTGRSPKQSDIYQMLHWYNWLSWRWAQGYSKHVGNRNKFYINRNVRQVGYLLELYQDARSPKYKILKM